MWTAKNRYFPHRSWELCTAYSKGGREGGGLEALARKFDPVSKSCFLHTSCFAVNLPFGCGVVELQFLHRIFHGGDFFEEKQLKVRAFIMLRFAFHDALFDSGIF